MKKVYQRQQQPGTMAAAARFKRVDPLQNNFRNGRRDHTDFSCKAQKKPTDKNLLT